MPPKTFIDGPAESGGCKRVPHPCSTKKIIIIKKSQNAQILHFSCKRKLTCIMLATSCFPKIFHSIGAALLTTQFSCTKLKRHQLGDISFVAVLFCSRPVFNQDSNSYLRYFEEGRPSALELCDEWHLFNHLSSSVCKCLIHLCFDYLIVVCFLHLNQ